MALKFIACISYFALRVDVDYYIPLSRLQELSRNVIFSLKFRYRLPNDFLVSSLQIVFDHSCVKYASYGLLQMKEEDLSFTNMCHLLIIIEIKL